MDDKFKTKTIFQIEKEEYEKKKMNATNTDFSQIYDNSIERKFNGFRGHRDEMIKIKN
jgi:hypothetical protein